MSENSPGIMESTVRNELMTNPPKENSKFDGGKVKEKLATEWNIVVKKSPKKKPGSGSGNTNPFPLSGRSSSYKTETSKLDRGLVGLKNDSSPNPANLLDKLNKDGTANFKTGAHFYKDNLAIEKIEEENSIAENKPAPSVDLGKIGMGKKWKKVYFDNLSTGKFEGTSLDLIKTAGSDKIKFGIEKAKTGTSANPRFHKNFGKSEV